MALRDTILSNTDPIIGMVRTTNVLLASKSAADIRAVLNDHSFPRIRMRILTATKSFVNGEGSGKQEGLSIWFDDLRQMADPFIQAQVDTEIETMISTNPLIRDAIYSIAAKLTGSYLTNALAAQVAAQANYAAELERQAMEDLEKLLRTPFFTGTVATFRETQASAAKAPRIFMALDIDDNTSNYTSSTNIGVTYTGVVVAGQARMWIGLDTVVVNVNVGDKPNLILNRLAAQWRTVQTTRNLTNVAPINVVLAPDEGFPVAGTRKTQYKDYSINPLGTPVGTPVSPAISTNLSFMQATPYQYDKTVDFLNVTMELWSETVLGSAVFDQPGIKGLLFGVEPVYSGLTNEGPHSVIIDLTTGERTSQLQTTNNNDATLSDTFYFELTTAGDTAQGQVEVLGTVTVGDQFSIVINGSTYTYTAILGDTPITVAAALAPLVDADANVVAFTDASPNDDIVIIQANAIGSAGNAITLTAPFVAGSASLVASGATLTGGRNVNTLSQNGVVTFRSQEMVDVLNPVPLTVNRLRSVNVTTGMTVLDVVLALANDIATFSATSRILGAVRAPTRFVIEGTPYNAPGLTIVPYTRDTVHYNIVFDMLTVPSELKFAALPRILIADPIPVFDNLAKSLVLPAKMLNPSGGGSTTDDTPISQTNQGRVFLSEPAPSARFKKAFEAIRRLNNE